MIHRVANYVSLFRRPRAQHSGSSQEAETKTRGTIVGWHWASRFVTALQEVNLITLIEMPLTSLKRE